VDERIGGVVQPTASKQSVHLRAARRMFRDIDAESDAGKQRRAEHGQKL
jgi:hypothetical protein